MTDILLTDDGDLLFENGDLAVGDSVVQHQRELLHQAVGDNRYAPTTGVGVAGYLLDTDTGELQSRIRSELVRDGLPGILDASLTNNLTLYA